MTTLWEDTLAMKRRNFIKGAALAGAGAVAPAAAFPTPGLSQGRIEWRMVTTWPKNCPGLGVGAVLLHSAHRCRVDRVHGLRRISRPLDDCRQPHRDVIGIVSLLPRAGATEGSAERRRPRMRVAPSDVSRGACVRLRRDSVPESFRGRKGALHGLFDHSLWGRLRDDGHFRPS